MVHWKWESQVIGLLESLAIPLKHFLPINKDILYASDCIGGKLVDVGIVSTCTVSTYGFYFSYLWSDTVCLKFWDFWIWLYFRGIEEWHVWKAHLNYWRFLLSILDTTSKAIKPLYWKYMNYWNRLQNTPIHETYLQLQKWFAGPVCVGDHHFCLGFGRGIWSSTDVEDGWHEHFCYF